MGPPPLAPPPSGPLPPASGPLGAGPGAFAPPAPRYTGDTTENDVLLLGVGVGLTVLGAVGMIAGIGIAANSERTDPCYSGTCPDIELELRAGGLVLAFVGLGMLGAGIPMIAVGARQVPELAKVGGAQLELSPSGLRLRF